LRSFVKERISNFCVLQLNTPMPFTPLSRIYSVG
jgi:hypothetical protein